MIVDLTLSLTLYLMFDWSGRAQLAIGAHLVLLPDVQAEHALQLHAVPGS